MNDEIRRILKLVDEGKISAADATSLIEALEEAQKRSETPPPFNHEAQTGETRTTANDGNQQRRSEPTAGKDPLKAFLDTIEDFGRDVTKSVDWKEINKQVKVSAKQGLDSLKTGLESIREGRGFPFFGLGESREVELPLSVPAGKILKVDNSVGVIRVSRCEGAGSVKARAFFQGLNSEETARRASNYMLVIEESEKYVEIRQPDFQNMSVDLWIELPDPTELEIKSESGDIHVADNAHSVRVHARSGDVRIMKAVGAVEVNLISGDVSLEECAGGRIVIENRSGDISVDQVTGELVARTTSGDVRIDKFSGAFMTVESVSGDVSASFVTPITGTYDLRTVSGDVHLMIPDGSDCRVALSSLRGEVTSELSLKDQLENEQRLTGVLGNGGGRLDVSAVTGDVVLKLSEGEVTSSR